MNMLAFSSLLMLSCAALVLADEAPAKIIKCVKCNSFTEGEEWCSSTDEIKKRIESADTDSDHFVTCDTADAPLGIGNVVSHCRKLEQEIDAIKGDGSVRVIRECAFSGEVVDGQKRTGNKGIRIFNFQCNDKDYCNASTVHTVSLMALIVAVLAVFVRL